MTFLTNDERAQLRAQHKQERDKRVRDLIKAVLLSDKGWTVTAIAEALLLSEDAIRDHISEYKESKKLKPESGGSIEKLSVTQSKQLEEHLQQLGFVQKSVRYRYRDRYRYRTEIRDIFVNIAAMRSNNSRPLAC